MSELRSKHAFGQLERVDSAINSGTIDAYDILFLTDANGKPYVGWVDKNGEKVVVRGGESVLRVDSLPTSDGDENVVYIYNNEAYIWNGTQCVAISKSADLSALETQVADMESLLESKIDASAVQSMVDAAVEEAVEEAASTEVVEF